MDDAEAMAVCDQCGAELPDVAAQIRSAVASAAARKTGADMMTPFQKAQADLLEAIVARLPWFPTTESALAEFRAARADEEAKP